MTAGSDSVIFVEGVFEFAHCTGVFVFTAEGVEQFEGGAYLVEGRQLQNLDVFDALHAGVGVFFEQGIEYGLCLFVVAVENVTPALRVDDALLTRQRRLTIDDVQYYVEGVGLVAEFAFEVFGEVFP